MQGSAGGCRWRCRRNDPSRGYTTAARPTPVATAGACDGGACVICLESDPPHIQSGCACRGDAGFAHVECRAEAATHRMTQSDALDGWWKCGTCGQEFTGAMRLGLAEVWWSTVHHLPKDDKQQFPAANILALAFQEQGRYPEAEAKYRENLRVARRGLGSENPTTLDTVGNLAALLSIQGKFIEAEPMYREVIAFQRRVLGPEHEDTLRTAENLANTLVRLGKHAEAKMMHRETLAIQQRVLGPEHPDTVWMANRLAEYVGAVKGTADSAK